MAKWNRFFPNLREVVLELMENLFLRPQQDGRLGKSAVVIGEVNEVVKRSAIFIRNLERKKPRRGSNGKVSKSSSYLHHQLPHLGAPARLAPEHHFLCKYNMAFTVNCNRGESFSGWCQKSFDLCSSSC
jgi:hypothetical protein